MPEGHTQSIPYAWLDDAIDERTVLITASRRLARELRLQYDERQLAAGRKAWPTPPVAFWQDWLASQIETAASPSVPRIIDATASSILWERCLRKHVDLSLLNLNGLVRQARGAWQRLQEWRVPLQDVLLESRSHDERAFAVSAEAYAALLTANNWVDAAGVPECALGLLQAGAIHVPRRIIHAGFDRISPVVEALFSALGSAGCAVHAAPGESRVGHATASSHEDTDAEFRAAGAWARDILAHEPTARVAIVASDLEMEAGRYARLVREGLAPGWQTGGAEFAQSVNVSYGRRLSDFPAIHVALLCLRWVHRGLTSRDISVLLRSPFLGRVDDGGRARLDLRLRSLPDREWTVSGLADALDDPRNDPAPATWLQDMRLIATLQTRVTEKRAPAAWAALLDELLQNLGWPGEGKLQSSEFQLLNRWRDLLHELAAIDVVSPEITLSDAIGRVGMLARDTLYQPETERGLIALLGPLEAAGMEFEHLWVAGVDAGRWPASGHPLSLVSRSLQRRCGMPDSTPRDTLEYSRGVLARLAASSPQTHFSWARTAEDTTQSPSPMLMELGPREHVEPGDPGWYAASLAGAAELASVASDPAPPVTSVEYVAGGARTIQQQTVEPFAAFACGRLGVSELRRFEPGLSASLRGSLLHDALYRLLKHKPSQRDIAAWTESEVAERVDTAIDQAFAATLRQSDAVLRRLLAMERGRLRTVMSNFITAEKGRGAFSIDSVEERIEFVHAGVRLRLRADRIDRLPDGTLFIIDYKTGAVKNLLGRDGDPVELQVVVYAAALEDEVGGMALFNIDSRSIQYKGVGAGAEWGKVPAEAWPAQLAGWKARVRAAMEQIAAGDVRVNLQLGTEQSRPLNVLSRAEELKRGY